MKTHTIGASRYLIKVYGTDYKSGLFKVEMFMASKNTAIEWQEKRRGEITNINGTDIVISEKIIYKANVCYFE